MPLKTIPLSGWIEKPRWIRRPDATGFIRVRWQKLRLAAFARWDSWRLRNEPGEKIFLDCGSNFGQGALFFSRFFSPQDWKYILIEPNPACHPKLRRLARQRLSGRSQQGLLLPGAAWTQKGNRILYGADCGESSVGASLQPSHNRAEGVRRGQRRLSVPTFDLSKILEKVGQKKKSGPAPCLVMKLDIEGSEIPVLSHLMKCGTLRLLQALYVEWHSSFLPSGHREKVRREEASLTRRLAQQTAVRDWV